MGNPRATWASDFRNHAFAANTAHHGTGRRSDDGANQQRLQQLNGRQDFEIANL
jgi:hypothetical protein